MQKTRKKLLAILLFVIVLGVPAFFGVRFYMQQAKLKKDASDYFRFRYQDIEKPERISLDKLETMFEQHDKKTGEFFSECGRRTIAGILGIHHPVLNDPAQQEFVYRLSEEESKRSEQLLRDLIRHSNKIILLHYDEQATLLPTKETREILADALSFSDHKMSIGPLSVSLDYKIPNILLFPSGVGFTVLGRERYFISSRGCQYQRLEGAVSHEFIDAIFALRQEKVVE